MLQIAPHMSYTSGKPFQYARFVEWWSPVTISCVCAIQGKLIFQENAHIWKWVLVCSNEQSIGLLNDLVGFSGFNQHDLTRKGSIPT